MVRKRLIVVLTLNDGVLFRTRNFIPDYRYTLNFVDAWSVDELVVIDITRPSQGDREHFYEVVDDLAKKCFVPLAVGGGVKDLAEVRKLMSVGADKVIINSEAIRRPAFITEIASAYGSQCTVVSIDAKRHENKGYEVYTHFGTTPTGITPEDWALQAEKAGAGEIFLTSIEKDGTLEGYDNVLNQQVANVLSIPLLVCGGGGQWQHMVDAFNVVNVSAACTTNIYHFSEASIRSAKNYLDRNHVLVRT